MKDLHFHITQEPKMLLRHKFKLSLHFSKSGLNYKQEYYFNPNKKNEKKILSILVNFLVYIKKDFISNEDIKKKVKEIDLMIVSIDNDLNLKSFIDIEFLLEQNIRVKDFYLTYFDLEHKEFFVNYANKRTKIIKKKELESIC